MEAVNNNLKIQPKSIQNNTSNVYKAPLSFPEQKPDAVELSTKETHENTGLSNNTKAALGVAAAVLTAIGIYAGTRGRGSASSKKAINEASKKAAEEAKIAAEKAAKAAQEAEAKAAQEAKIAAEKAAKQAAEKQAKQAAEKTAKEAEAKAAQEAKIAEEKAAKEAEAKAAEKAKIAAEKAEKAAKEAEAKAAQEAKIAAEKAANEIKENIINLDEPLKITENDKFSNRLCSGSNYLRQRRNSKETINAVRECENLTFDSPNLKLMKDKYDENNVYDLAHRYAVVANNTAQAKGSGAIINEVPEIFQGIETKELVEKLNKLGALLDKRAVNKFSIGGKEYTAKFIGSGQINDVYKITDKSGKSLCFRKAQNPHLIESAQGIYYETAVTQEAFKAGVVDIPKLYMANPVGKYANDGNTEGAWQLLEFVEGKKELPKDGLKLREWMESKGLAHFDINDGTCVGNIYVDLGGIADKAKTFGKMDDLLFMLRGYTQGETTSQMLEAMIEGAKRTGKQ